MNKEELLKERWKVIGDFPGNHYSIGSIIDNSNFSMRDEKGNDFIVLPNGEEFHPKDYPGIFHQLEWWEELPAKDYPEYMRSVHNTKVYKVLKSDSLWISVQTDPYGNDEWTHIMQFTPATEEEFITNDK